jgi:hypothetical protein
LTCGRFSVTVATPRASRSQRTGLADMENSFVQTFEGRTIAGDGGD